jgi:predicted permease
VPWLARALLAAALHPDDRRFALADLEEEFEERVGRLGAWSARRWYRGQVVRSLPSALRGRLLRRRHVSVHKGDGMMRRMAQNMLEDLRLAARGWRKAPGLMVITVLSLGVGIGAVTAVFGVANSVLFRGAVGISDPETLVVVYTTEDDGEAYGSSSFPDYLDMLDQVDAIEDAAAVNIRTVALREGDVVRPLLAEEVTGNYFAVTGIRPVIGRAFTVDESLVGGGARVVLISHGVWQRDFGGRADALGATLRLNGYLHTIVGVVPDGVLSRRVPLEPDVWVPLASVGDEAATRAETLEWRHRRDYLILARLAEGSSWDALSGQLAVLSARLQNEYREAWRDDQGNARAFSLLGEEDSRVRPGARMVLGGIAAFFLAAAGLILLIACANVTTLFLARAANRSREMALRLSLGASRRRLVVMLLTEGLVPGLGAGLVGLAVASWINHGLNVAVASIPFGLPIRLSLGIDGRVVAVAVLLSMGASLVFGLTPALEGSRPDLVRSLKGDGAAGRGNLRLRNLLVGAQCAASVVLLVGATLFVRSLRNAADVDLGLEADRVALATKKLDAEGYGPDEGMQYIRDLRERLGARSDVEVVHVARSMEMTLMSVNPTLPVEVEAVGYTPADPDAERYWRNSVTPGYLDMLGVEILRGRGLADTDVAGAPLVAVVNETFAQRLWPGEDAIGRTFQASGRAPAGSRDQLTEKRSFRVVGIAKDGKYFDFDDSPIPYYWTAIFQDYAARIVVAAKGTVSAEAMIPVLREGIELAAGEVQLTPPTTLERQLSYQFIHLRIASRVLRWAGAFGLLLAVIGIYGIVSFAVTQRTREMAIRMAIGAERRQLLDVVVRDGMRPALLGLALGTVFAFFGARLMTGVLVGVGPLDPLAFAGGASVLVVAALAASIVPARRALAIDPMQTLQEE